MTGRAGDMKKTKRCAPETVKKIVESSKLLFASEGYTGASMRRIAEAAGVRAATLYHYYPSKEEILKAIFLDFYVALTEFYRELKPELGELDSDSARFVFFLREHNRFLGRHAHFAFLFYLEGIRPGSPLFGALETMTFDSTKALRDLASGWETLKADDALALLLSAIGINTFFHTGRDYFAKALAFPFDAGHFNAVCRFFAVHGNKKPKP